MKIKDTSGLNELQNKQQLEELKREITKGWNGPTSTRKVKDIIKNKTEPPQISKSPVFAALSTQYI